MISKYELEELLEELEKIRGSHTELVTVYIPAGGNINIVANQIEAEKSTASNIKDKSTRKNVLDALESIGRELKKYKQTSENGMAIFCGNTAEKEGQQDIKLWAIEPPFPLKTRMYRCDKEFVLEPLKQMLEAEFVYGLVAMDRKDAILALLEGKQIKILRKMSSGVPGKYKTGGQCLAEDTLIMKSDGDIIQIKDAHNPLLVISENFNIEKSEETPLITKWQNKKQLFKIITSYPRIEIKASKDHTFFVRTENGIEEKRLEEIKEGDYLIMPEKINLNLEYQRLDFKPKIESTRNLKEIRIPEILGEDLARLLGYYLGDGSYEVDRLTFFEQRKEVAEFYKQLLEKVFGVETEMHFREAKNYWQIRIYSRIVTQLLKQIFQQKDKTLNEKIPPIILKSPDSVLASFIAGFFDAEGYVVETRVALGINNETLTKQLQFVLLRLGAISSLWEYDNRKNPYSKKIRYTISIEDIDSLINFKKLIPLASEEKQKKLEDAINNRSDRNKVRQIVVNGKEVAKILRNSGIATTQFMCPDFFVNKKQLNKELFKRNILDKVNNKELKRRLEFFYNSNLIAVKIKKIEALNEESTIDIETKNHNFIADGLIVHNSAQRFERIREGLAKEFYRRIADAMKEVYFNMPKLKGIIIGGPVPTKEDFLKEGQLVTQLREKVVALKDIGYADEHGIELLVEASGDVLQEQEITYEKNLLEGFFNRLGKGEKVAYKKEDIEKAFKYGAIDLLILSKKLGKQKIEELRKKAENISAKVEIVSTETPEGEQFWNLGGVGALLRFEV